MSNFLKKLESLISKLNEAICDYKNVSQDACIPSKAFINWGISLANQGLLDQAIEKFESSSKMAMKTPDNLSIGA